MLYTKRICVANNVDVARIVNVLLVGWGTGQSAHNTVNSRYNSPLTAVLCETFLVIYTSIYNMIKERAWSGREVAETSIVHTQYYAERMLLAKTSVACI